MSARLQVAAGSHAAGVYDFDIAGGAGGIEITDPLEGQLGIGRFRGRRRAVVPQHDRAQGRAKSQRQLRMSMDVRYQLVSEPFNIDNANPDGQPLSWDDVYAGWRSDALKYYWQRLPLTLEAIRPRMVRQARRARLRIRRGPRSARAFRAATHRGARCRPGEARPRAATARRAAVTAFDVRHYDSIGSTNDEAQRLAAEGAAHGTVVHAR